MAAAPLGSSPQRGNIIRAEQNALLMSDREGSKVRVGGLVKDQQEFEQLPLATKSAEHSIFEGFNLEAASVRPIRTLTIYAVKWICSLVAPALSVCSFSLLIFFFVMPLGISECFVVSTTVQRQRRASVVCHCTLCDITKGTDTSLPGWRRSAAPLKKNSFASFAFLFAAKITK